ncbi:MAG: DUF116 domain-containing protein [Candidatus Saccharibacteria bacterium]
MMRDMYLLSFVFLSTCLAGFFLLVLAAILAVHFNVAPALLNAIEYTLVAGTILLTVLLLLIITAVVYVYMTKSANPQLVRLSRTGVNILLPVLMALSGLFKSHRKSIMIFYIKLNNTIIKALPRKYQPQNILILLPHCLQNSSCPYKVTNFIDNCRKCLNCSIGRIKEKADNYRITGLEVVTGGTSALNVVKRIKPELVIAVACERDLTAGIAGIKGIPAIGLLNERPYGPCINTRIGMEEFSETLASVLEHPEMDSIKDN